MNLLEVRGLSRRFGGLKAVDDLGFTVSPGVIKSVIGPNGAGKTTLFNLISGFQRPDAGQVLFQGRSIGGLPPHAVAGAGIARTFQQIQLFPGMTVLENLLMGRHRHTRAGFVSGLLRLPRGVREQRSARERCLEILDFVGLTAVAGQEAASLPYGQQRLVELARAISCEPALLLLDEPAAGLNTHETEELAALLERTCAAGYTLLVVEHDMSLVMSISQEVLVLSYGRKIAEDSPRAVQRDPEVIRVYLGEDDAEGS